MPFEAMLLERMHLDSASKPAAHKYDHMMLRFKGRSAGLSAVLTGASRAMCRDLKSSNVLLSAEGVAKLADVGLATVVTNEEQTLDSITPGTWAFAAPELILGASVMQTASGTALLPEAAAVSCKAPQAALHGGIC